jgi:hypothetical protein
MRESLYRKSGDGQFAHLRLHLGQKKQGGF